MIYLYLVPTREAIPVGTEYRVLFEDGDRPLVIQTREPVALEEHPQTWPNGVPCVDDGCLAEWVVADGDATVADVKAKARELLEQVKPLAYQDPAAVKAAINETFTPEEFNGVMGA